MLEAKAGVDPVHGIHGMTPLIQAAANQYTWMVRCLLEGGADWRVVDNEGDSAMDMCRKNFDLETSLLLQDSI